MLFETIKREVEKKNSIQVMQHTMADTMLLWRKRQTNTDKDKTTRHDDRQSRPVRQDKNYTYNVGRSYQCGPICQWRQFRKRVASWGTLRAPHWNGQQRGRRVGSRCLHAHSQFVFPWWADRSLRGRNRERDKGKHKFGHIQKMYQKWRVQRDIKEIIPVITLQIII